MKQQIIPSLIATNQNELNHRLNKIRNTSETFHLDLMDGKFVKNKSLMFNFTLPKNKNFELHLMGDNPKNLIKKHIRKSKAITFHIESTKNPKDLINLIKRNKKKIGIAINPKTSITKIKHHIKNINKIIIMTVNPGKYGAKFQEKTLSKIKELRKQNPKLNIQVDGSVNNKTIKRLKKAGANIFVVGSYLQNSNNPKESITKLKSLIK